MAPGFIRLIFASVVEFQATPKRLRKLNLENGLLAGADGPWLGTLKACQQWHEAPQLVIRGERRRGGDRTRAANARVPWPADALR